VPQRLTPQRLSGPSVGFAILTDPAVGKYDAPKFTVHIIMKGVPDDRLHGQQPFLIMIADVPNKLLEN